MVRGGNRCLLCAAFVGARQAAAAEVIRAGRSAYFVASAIDTYTGGALNLAPRVPWWRKQ